MADDTRPKLVGINHVALEVGDLEEALDFYRRIFGFSLRGRGRRTAFLDMGDQFLALSEGRRQSPDAARHLGLVVDDRAPVRLLAEAAGAQLLDGPGLDFLDPWGNHIQVVDYRDIQFTKTEAVLAYLGVSPEKGEEALNELREKGIAQAPPP